MLTFDNVKRGTTITAVPFDYACENALRHWLEELSVTGWDICDRRTVLDHLGEDFKVELTAPTRYGWPGPIGKYTTDNVMYFVSFYDAADARAKIDEILGSKENRAWGIEEAGKAAKAYEYQQKMEADPSPFDWRRNLDN